MSPLILLILFALPAQAQEATGGLQCQYDANNPKDPYAKMKKENEDKIAAGIKTMGLSLPAGRLAREEMVQGLNKHLEQLCWAKKQMEAAAASISAKKKEAEGLEAGQSGCNAYSGINRQLNSFQGTNKAYQESLVKALREQRGRYQTLIKKDHEVLKEHMQNPKVVSSFREAWGRLATEKGDVGNKQGIIPGIYVQIQGEQNLNGSRKEGYDQLSGSIQSLKEKCPSLAGDTIGDEKLKAGAQPPKNEWGNMGDDTPGVSDPNAEQSPAADPSADANANALNDPNATPNPDKTPPYVDETGGNPENLGPVKEDKGPSWVARNKGVLLLGAGTAAVVGGALWYKHEQDKKMDETVDWINKQANSSTATTTVTSTSTTTTTSTVARTMSVTGFPSGAAVNYVIPKITASVTGSGGVEVSIACVSECTLTGTLTKTTVGGKAEFSDLYFTAPHEGVQLRVSASGLDSVASPGSFNVVDPSGRE